VTYHSAENEMYRNMLYRCEFKKLVGVLDKRLGGLNSDGAKVSCLVFKAAALFEMHRIADINGIVDELQSISTKNEAVQLDLENLVGRLAFFQGKFDVAREKFEFVLNRSADNLYFRARALLGLGNVMYMERHFTSVPPLLAVLEAIDLSAAPDLSITRSLLSGNYSWSAAKAYEKARHHFHTAMSAAHGTAWTYFVLRSLWGLAFVARQEGKVEELRSLLGILRACINPVECPFMAYTLNHEFKDDAFAIPTPIEFDDQRLQIKVRGAWHLFHEKPLIFRFLRLLSRNTDFLQKEDISRHLWEGEAYNPAVHDLRIYDLAKRSRSVIEAFDEQPVILLSGRSGYKLASKTQHCGAES